MSSIIAYCPNCGSVLDPGAGAGCPQCAAASYPITRREPRIWGTGTGLLVWLVSTVLTLGIPLVFGLLYLILKMFRTGQPPTEETLSRDVTLALLTAGMTFPAHLLTLLICWLVVTSWGKRPFLQTISWGRPSLLDWVYSIGLAVLMMGAAYIFQKLLPHNETGLEKLLKLSYAVRVMVAALAVLTAPLVEEVVYRGVLYAGIEKDWGKTAGVVVVTFLFALVHVPQYKE